jgi:hypothetical protein
MQFARPPASHPTSSDHRRAISPFQAAYDKLDLPRGIAMATPNGFEKDSHRVIAFHTVIVSVAFMMATSTVT